MSKQLRVYREGAKTEFDYQILWEEDFTKLADAVKKLELSCGKICIVADDTVGNLYGKEVQKALEELDVTVDLYTFPAGEASKNLDTVKELYAFLIEHHYTRKDVLAALGGGVTGDLTGYAAAKGLEFERVYILDVNEGCMPYQKAVLDPEIEEERRMFYVGMTRAKKELHLYAVEERFGKKMEPSRFLVELEEAPKRGNGGQKNGK